MMIPLRKVNEIPATLNPGAIERVVAEFIKDSHADKVPMDLDGYYNQTIENIAATLLFKTPGRYVWLAEDAGEVVAFALTHVAKDVDNKLCYWMTNAHVAKKWRGRKEPKVWLQQLREDAKATFCKHIIIPSSRNTEAYCRFLGKGWHPYVVLLKQDL